MPETTPNAVDTTKKDAATAAAPKPEANPAPVPPVTPPVTPPSTDPLKAELERVRQTQTKTELEKALHKRKIMDERIAELKKAEGVTDPDDLDDIDDTPPATDPKVIERKASQQAALSIAESTITDETERELVIHHLKNTVVPSGNAALDLQNARHIVNSVKNSRIAEEAQRKMQPSRTAASGGAPGTSEPPFEPTADEAAFMRPPFNLSKEKILAARKASESK